MKASITRASVALAAVGALLVGPTARPSQATSHLESPLAIADLRTNGHEMYAFTTPDNPDTVTFIGTYACCQTFYVDPAQQWSTTVGEWIPFTRMEFDKDAQYEIHIDPTGSGKPAITYQWTFRDSLPLLRRYTLKEIRPGQPDKVLVNDHAVAPPDLNLGALVAPNYAPLRAQGVADLPGGGKAFAGKTGDPFPFDLRWLAFFAHPVATVLPAFNVTGLFNSNAIAIQVPKKDLALNGDLARNPVIGAWATASRKSVNLINGQTTWRQVSRVANPGWSVIHLPILTRDRYNYSKPEDDHRNAEFMKAAKFPNGSYTNFNTFYKMPAGPRDDLYEINMTGLTTAFGGPFKQDLNSQVLNKDVDKAAFVPSDEMRLNMSTPLTPQPKRYAFLEGDQGGSPNGRRLTDEVAGASIRLQLGQPTYPLPTNPVADRWWKDSPIAEPPGGFLKPWPYIPHPHALGRLPYRPQDIFNTIQLFFKGYGIG